MDVLREINSARAVEAKTGWPRPLCRRFVSAVDRRSRLRNCLQWGGISVVASLVSTGLAGLVIVAVDAHSWSLVIAIAASGWAFAAGAVMTAYLSRRRRKVLRELTRFLAEPSCLKCQYPVPAVEEPVCPECGEPVPAEIARLAGYH